MTKQLLKFQHSLQLDCIAALYGHLGHMTVNSYGRNDNFEY